MYAEFQLPFYWNRIDRIITQGCTSLKVCQLAFTDISYMGYQFICLREAASHFGSETNPDEASTVFDIYQSNINGPHYYIYDFSLVPNMPNVYYDDTPSPFASNESLPYDCSYV